MQLYHYISADCLNHRCILSVTGFSLSLSRTRTQNLFQHSTDYLLSQGISLCNFSPNWNHVSNYVLIFCFEISLDDRQLCYQVSYLLLCPKSCCSISLSLTTTPCKHLIFCCLTNMKLSGYLYVKWRY
jgi:hypothetical protein